MSPEFKSALKKGAGILNITLSELQISQMEIHADQLLLYNRKMNLTAITAPVIMAEKHFLDSIAVTEYLKDANLLMDIGSGGGFPGLPLKIMNPHLNVILVDASRKKVNFLKHVIRTLGLKKIDAVHTRVEDLHENREYAGGFDCVVSRAFTELERFADLAKPFLTPDGTICAMKGKQASQEIVPIIRQNYIVSNHSYRLPFENSDRNIVRLQFKI
jgi:16S rRNA (guanine527-N7)-methyltransferase